MVYSGVGEAANLIKQYKNDGISIIIRDGTLDQCPYGAGDLGILREFRDCVLAVKITGVAQKTYVDLTEEEWRAAGYKAGAQEGLELVEATEIALDSPVCVLTMDLDSLSVRHRAYRYGSAHQKPKP